MLNALGKHIVAKPPALLSTNPARARFGGITRLEVQHIGSHRSDNVWFSFMIEIIEYLIRRENHHRQTMAAFQLANDKLWFSIPRFDNEFKILLNRFGFNVELAFNDFRVQARGAGRFGLDGFDANSDHS